MGNVVDSCGECVKLPRRLRELLRPLPDAHLLDTASAKHDPSPYLNALRLHGTLCMLGIADRIDVASFSLRWGRHSLAGSGTGSPSTTRQMLDFCARNTLTADVEVLPAHQVQTALDRLARGDVRYRYVLDMSALPTPESPAS